MKASKIFGTLGVAFLVTAILFCILMFNVKDGLDLSTTNPKDFIFILLLLQGFVFVLISIALSKIEKTGNKNQPPPTS